MDGEMVAERLDLQPREVVVDALQLLQHRHVGLRRLQPSQHVGQPRLDGVDVPGGDAQHRDDSLGHVAMLSNSRSDEHPSELQSPMRISYAAFYLKKKKTQQ